MVMFDSPFFQVSQGFFGGWKIVNKMSGAVSIPSSLQKERIGFVWMQVRRTKKSQSVDSKMSEDVIFGSFAKDINDPSSDSGDLWRDLSPDELADRFISVGNEYMNSAGRGFR